MKGDMSLVGPRPLLPDTVDDMGSDGIRRGLVRPGLTGWAQVNGNARLSGKDKLALDLWYIDHASVALDLRIILKTIGVVFAGERINRSEVGRAYAGGHSRRRSEEHTSELQSLMRNSYAVFYLKKKKHEQHPTHM